MNSNDFFHPRGAWRGGEGGSQKQPEVRKKAKKLLGLMCLFSFFIFPSIFLSLFFFEREANKIHTMKNYICLQKRYSWIPYNSIVLDNRA
jgi:hypothetical protein